MKRKFDRSCLRPERCFTDVVIGEYAATHGGFTRGDILSDIPSLKLTPRQLSYRLNQLVKDGTLTLMGQGRYARYMITDRPLGVTYVMNLNPEPFDLIKSGKKTVEMRLNDEIRRYIRSGDNIQFINTETGEELFVRVVERREFPSFDELYAAYPKSVIGYAVDEEANLSDMLKYYTEENIKKYGALAIGVSLE
jgi:ASC-1-like (ASCH) protein